MDIHGDIFTILPDRIKNHKMAQRVKLEGSVIMTNQNLVVVVVVVVAP
jgi:hypothetical protein